MCINNKPIICVFAKPPVAGTVKTRLIHAYGKESARSLAEAFIKDTLENLRRVDWAEIVVATTFPLGGIMESLTSGLEIIDQGPGDLGRRIERVMGRLVKKAPFVLIIGADTPGLPRNRLEMAKQLLESHDGAIGPARDGGFYLLALKNCPRNLFKNLPWGTDDTCKKTRQRLAEHGLNIATLETWFDVDRPKDVGDLLGLIVNGSIHAPASRKVIENLPLAGPI